MRRLILLFLATLGACATVPQTVHRPGTFLAHDIIRVETEYATPTVPLHVSTYGPVQHEHACRADAAAQPYPKDSMYKNGCLTIMFVGPLPHGAVVIQPEARPENNPIGVALIAVEYNTAGRWLGAQPLHVVSNADTCKFQANDLKQGWYKDGSVPKGNSLLIYCVGIPKWEPKEKSETVRWTLAPARPWNPLNGTAFQHRAG